MPDPETKREVEDAPQAPFLLDAILQPNGYEELSMASLIGDIDGAVERRHHRAQCMTPLFPQGIFTADWSLDMWTGESTPPPPNDWVHFVEMQDRQAETSSGLSRRTVSS